MNLGDIFWADLPPRGGHVQRGRRPVIIFQTEEVSGAVPTVLVIPLTRQQTALRFPGTVRIEADEQNGLLQSSIALVFQLGTLDRRNLGEPLGRLAEKDLNPIRDALDFIIGRPLASSEEKAE